jgi:hypothetical protein
MVDSGAFDSDQVNSTIDRAAVVMTQTSGVLPTEHKTFLDARNVIQELVRRNLFEEVPGGVRFVFDQLLDFVLARQIEPLHVVNDHGRQDPRLEVRVSPSVMALAIEYAFDGGDHTRVKDVCERLVEEISGPREMANWAVSSLFGVGKLSELDDLLLRGVEKAISADLAEELSSIGGLAWTLPRPAFEILLRHLITEEGDYGWRQKDVSTGERRRSMESRTKVPTLLPGPRGSEYGSGQEGMPLSHVEATGRVSMLVPGPVKLLSELFDVAATPASSLLQKRLSDETPLNSMSESEADVGSWCLCMIWVFRNRIGFSHIFKHVLLANARGSGALLKAVADEEGDALASELDGLPSELGAQYYLLIRNAWLLLIGNQAGSAEYGEIKRRAGVSLTLLADHLKSLELQDLLYVALQTGLNVDLDVESLLERFAREGNLQRLTINAAFRSGSIDLELAKCFATQTYVWDKFVCSILRDSRSYNSVLTLGSLLSLLLEIEIQKRLDDGDVRYAIESFLYRLEYDEADRAGFLPLLETIVILWPEEEFSTLLYPALGDRFGWVDETDGHRRLRISIVDAIRRTRLTRGIAKRVLTEAFSSRNIFERNVPFVVDAALSLPPIDFLQAIDETFPMESTDTIGEVASEYLARSERQHKETAIIEQLLKVPATGSAEAEDRTRIYKRRAHELLRDLRKTRL